jgi:2'-5' RNA ligase
MTTERLFVALSLPAPVRDSLVALMEPVTGVAWTPPPQLHVTLRFLGEISDDESPSLVERLARVNVQPFLLPLEGVGAFPPKRAARVLWAGVGGGHPRLFQLRQQLDDTLLAAGLQMDLRTFHPHVTLGRCQPESAAAVTHWLHRHREFVGPLFQVDAFGLYASTLHPSGAVHTLKREFPLASAV